MKSSQNLSPVRQEEAEPGEDRDRDGLVVDVAAHVVQHEEVRDVDAAYCYH